MNPRPFFLTVLAGVLGFGLAVGQVQDSFAAKKTSTASGAAHEVTLKTIQEAVHKLRVASLDVVSDVEQRDMVVTGEPDLIQPIAYDDKKPIGWARKMLELGPALPPKKTWLDEDVSRLGRLIDILQSEIQAVDFPAEKKEAAMTHWNDVTAVMQDVQNHRKTLETLSQAVKPDNIQIGKEALAIYDAMGKLKKPWEATVKAVRSKS